jgi:uncharacterized membrane protein YcjF (UPF0283 family)
MHANLGTILYLIILLAAIIVSVWTIIRQIRIRPRDYGDVALFGAFSVIMWPWLLINLFFTPRWWYTTAALVAGMLLLAAFIVRSLRQMRQHDRVLRQLQADLSTDRHTPNGGQQQH